MIHPSIPELNLIETSSLYAQIHLLTFTACVKKIIILRRPHKACTFSLFSDRDTPKHTLLHVLHNTHCLYRTRAPPAGQSKLHHGPWLLSPSISADHVHVHMYTPTPPRPTSIIYILVSIEYATCNIPSYPPIPYHQFRIQAF